jgi:hypothetical protein
MGRSPIVLIQGPPGTGKSLTLAMIAISFAIRGLKCVIMTLSNNAANEIGKKILTICDSGGESQQWPYRHPNIVCWLTPANDQAIMNNSRVPGVPETIVQMSMARRMQVRVRQIINKGEEWEKRAAQEWLDLWRRCRVLNKSQLDRYKELTYLWEKQCLGCNKPNAQRL